VNEKDRRVFKAWYDTLGCYIGEAVPQREAFRQVWQACEQQRKERIAELEAEIKRLKDVA